MHTFYILVFIAISINIDSSLSSTFFEYDPSWPEDSVPALPLHGSAAVPDFEDHILLLHRGSNYFIGRNSSISEAVVVVIDRISGRMLRQWGENMFFYPHGIEAAKNGDIFVTDSVLHQVFKFAYNSTTQLWNNEPIITLGQRFVSGNDTTHLCSPQDVAIEPDTENFYVADGYCNARVIKFDRCGNYLLEFSAGTSDSTIPIIPFHVVHKLIVAVRHSPNTNRALRRSVNSEDVVVVVADRDNCRIQYFYGNGSFMYEQTHEDLGIPHTYLMSVVHVDVNPANAPYYSNVPADFGIIYAVDLGSDDLFPDEVPDLVPEVFEIAVGESSPTILSSFRTNNTNPYVRRGVPHDLTVSRDGQHVYVIISNSDSLIIKKFEMRVESGAGISFQFFSGTLFVIMASLSATGARLLLQ